MTNNRRPFTLALVSFALFASAAFADRSPDVGNGELAEVARSFFEQHAVAADHPAASAAGESILARGGNAADAAIATMLALGVVSPASSGLGGGGFALYFRKRDRSLTFIDFRETAPRAATPSMFARGSNDDAAAATRSQVGGLAVAVPAEPFGIEELSRRFGRTPLSELAAPAVLLARNGWTPSLTTATYSAGLARDLETDSTSRPWLPVLLALVRTPSTPARLQNEAHARTLEAFGATGAAYFRSGAFAQELVTSVQSRGGILTLDDLRDYRVRQRAPLTETRFGYRVVTAPPPSAGGYTLLASLGFLERVVRTPRVAPEDEILHALAESWKGPYVDRATYFGDPDHIQLPLARLRAAGRMRARARLYSPATALPASTYALPLPATRAATTRLPNGGGTSHLCVVDREGNIASVTTTVNLPFGARFTVGGIWMNDEMDDFAREENAPNAFGLPGGAANLPGPGRRPVSTMTPTIVFRGRDPVLCIGASGGSRIVTAVTQVLVNTLLRDRPVADAIAAERVHHQGMPAELGFERLRDSSADPAPRQALRAALEARGHTIRESEGAANVQAIHIVTTRTGRELRAASDPRKGGAPAGR